MYGVLSLNCIHAACFHFRFGSDDIHYLLDFDMAILGQPFEGKYL